MQGLLFFSKGQNTPFDRNCLICAIVHINGFPITTMQSFLLKIPFVQKKTAIQMDDCLLVREAGLEPACPE